MSRVEQIESQIQQLSDDELRAFRNWFAEYDAEMWDQQFAHDVEAGKLDHLAERALRDHHAGKSTKL
jgi:succinate dehydrogenase flavin-adding protein (antitoxin of CptAB toxin-antitoxin module)